MFARLTVCTKLPFFLMSHPVKERGGGGRESLGTGGFAHRVHPRIRGQVPEPTGHPSYHSSSHRFISQSEQQKPRRLTPNTWLIRWPPTP